MPKKTMEKNTKGNKNATKAAVKKVETKKTVKTDKVTVKPVVKEETTKKVVVKKERKFLKKFRGRCSSLFEKIVNNTPFAISLCVIIVLVAGLILTLCIKRVPRTKSGNQVIASVKGKTITADDLYSSLKETYGNQTLLNMIDTYISEKEVKFTKEDEDYVKQVIDYYKNYAEYYKTDLTTFLANYVGLTGIDTEDEFHDYVVADYKKTLAVQKYVADKASEKDLKDYYKDNYSDSLTVKHILIEVDKEAKDQDKADKDAYNKAVKLIQKLNKASVKELNSTFEKLAKDNSDDTETYSKGGLLKDVKKSAVEKEFWNAAYKLKDGKYTEEPVKTSYGYHIILRVSSTPVEKYNDIKADVKKQYAKSLLEKDTTLTVKKWDELRKQYKLSINDDLIKKLYKEAVKKGSTATPTTESSTEDQASTDK